MNNPVTPTPTDLPEALRLANALAYCDSSVASQAAAELRRLHSAISAAATPLAPFQQRVHPWMMECFGPMIAGDREERNHRFLEEALELVQATGCSASEAHQLVDYVYGRPVGEPAQEVGGVMVTLAALCLANGLDMHTAAETELARIWTKVEAIRAKQAAKPKHSPLPEGAAPQPPAALPGEQDAALSQAARDVLAERQRQINAEGWTEEHDDTHGEGEMCFAAAGYAAVASDHLQAITTGVDDTLTMDDNVSPPSASQPWPADWAFKPCKPRRALVKSGALILAEIERIDRAAAKGRTDGGAA